MFCQETLCPKLFHKRQMTKHVNGSQCASAIKLYTFYQFTIQCNEPWKMLFHILCVFTIMRTVHLVSEDTYHNSYFCTPRNQMLPPVRPDRNNCHILLITVSTFSKRRKQLRFAQQRAGTEMILHTEFSRTTI